MDSIQKRLFEMQDLKFRDFHAKLIPTVDKNTIIGVRTPKLRTLAKELIKTGDAFLFVKELPHEYFDENSLHSILMGLLPVSIEEVLTHIDTFLPYIDNWATCDVMSPKIFKKYPKEVLEKTYVWLESRHTYTKRFAIVTLLQFFLDNNFEASILQKLASIHSDEYYVNMALAWYYSFALIKQYDETVPLFEDGVLDKWVNNKAIQKAIESYRISDERKVYLRGLKR